MLYGNIINSYHIAFKLTIFYLLYGGFKGDLNLLYYE